MTNRRLLLAGTAAIGLGVSLCAGQTARATDLLERTVAGFRFPDRPPVQGRAIPDCTETRPDHLIGCAPRQLVLILPDEPVANAVYTPRRGRPRRPYPQLFVWGP